MINDVDETIKQILTKEGKLDPAEIDIVFDMPDREWSGSISKPTVNVYLYDIHENRDLRSNDWAVARSNGRATKTKPPARIDLSYLVTVWTNDTADQHRLLGHILSALLRYQEIPQELLQGSLANSTYPIPAMAAQQDGVLRNSADFWSALDNQLKPSINYVVTIPVDISIALEAPEVKTKVFRFLGDAGQGPEEQVQITGTVHRKGKLEDVVPEAILSIAELQMTATSGEDGQFVFPKMKLGDFTLRVTVPGEKERELALTVPSSKYDIEI